MSYFADRSGPARREGLVAVALLHVALGWALVSNLAPDWVDPPPLPPPPIITRNLPQPPPPAPKPPVDERVRVEQRAPDLRIDPDPLPRPIPPDGPVVTLDTDADPGPVTAGGGGGGETTGAVAPPPPPPAVERVPARASGRNAITDADYPASARRAGEEGAVLVRYTVDIVGRARGCAVEAGSGSDALDRATCAIIERRFRFAPARAGGEPVAETRRQTVRWTLVE